MRLRPSGRLLFESWHYLGDSKMRKSIVIVLLALAVPSLVQALTVLEPGCNLEIYTEYGPSKTHTYSMTFDNAGYLYLSQPYDNEVWRVSPDGAVTYVVGFNNTISGCEWTGSTVYGDFIYVTVMSEVLRVGPDGEASIFARGLPAASEIAVDASGAYGGHLYVTTGGQDHIYSIDPNGEVSKFTDWPGWTDGGGPVGMEFDRHGSYGLLMYVATSFGKKAPTISGIFAVGPDGTAVRFAPDIAVAREIALDPRGRFNHQMFAIAGDNCDLPMSIWRIDPKGNAIEFAVTDKPGRLGSLTFGPDGALYVCEFDPGKEQITISRITR